MMPSPDVTVRVDLSRIRHNAEAIAAQAGVPLIAVVKADAYGLGAVKIAGILSDLVEGFYVFDAAEAVTYELYKLTGRRSIALLGQSNDAADYLSHHIHPAAWTAERAAVLLAARPALSVDSGQQRFGCPLGEAESILRQTGVKEVFTHATTTVQAASFDKATRGVRDLFRHAAGTALLSHPSAAFNAVRPGMALYAGAARVSTPLIEVHQSRGPIGYTGFSAARHGVIRCGYSNGLRIGPCRINDHAGRILEVGMQSAFVEIAAGDRVGDSVILLGDGLSESEIASAWKCTPQETLLRLTSAGIRKY